MNSLDTTKAGVKIYLEDAGRDRKAQPYSAKAMRLAVFRFIADTLAIDDKDLRSKAFKQFEATPSWFGCNNSAGRQALGYITAEKEVLDELFDA